MYESDEQRKHVFGIEENGGCEGESHRERLPAANPKHQPLGSARCTPRSPAVGHPRSGGALARNFLKGKFLEHETDTEFLDWFGAYVISSRCTDREIRCPRRRVGRGGMVHVYGSGDCDGDDDYDDQACISLLLFHMIITTSHARHWRAKGAPVIAPASPWVHPVVLQRYYTLTKTKYTKH